MVNKKITVLLAEDHKIVRNGLRKLLELENDIQVLCEAENGLDAVKLAQTEKPMVVIMDLAMPKLNGLEASRQIVKSNPEIKIFILSAYADDGYIEKAVNFGASGYLIKQCSPHLLIQGIREVCRGSYFFSPDILARLQSIKKSQPNRNGMLKKIKQSLSEREAQVLQLIAEGKANKQIAAELEISIKTVEKHRQNLMKKLEIHDTAGLTRYAISEGIIESSSQQNYI